MKMTKNIVALKKGFIVAPLHGLDNKVAAMTVQAHLMNAGYMLDESAFEALSKSDITFITAFNAEIVEYLTEVLGGNRNYTALYKNFPQEVLALSDFELYLNAIIHYWSNGTWEPSTLENPRPSYMEKVKYTMLTSSTEDRFNQIFTDLTSMNTSLTPADQEIVSWFIESGSTLVLPKVIPFKETLCLLAAKGVEGLPVKTSTDVLRIAVSLSGGDVSLPKVPKAVILRVGVFTNRSHDNTEERAKFKFKKFTRKERKYLLGLLEQTNCDASEMILKDQRWIRLGEILHPGEYKRQYPKAASAFEAIRNTKVKSWYSILNKAFNVGLEEGLEVLSERPGEFARRIDWLIRTYPTKLNVDLIMENFSKAVLGTSNKVLFELYNHFENRLESTKGRSIMIKGSRKRTALPELPAIHKSTVSTIHSKIFETLKNKFSKLDSLGKCYIDEELKKIPLPTNMRSMNFSTKPILRGQRVPLDNPNAKIIRPFIHWFDQIGTQDLDLSVSFVGKIVEVLNFHNIRVGESIHSGDVRHRQGACAEYVDINIADALNQDFKYAVIDVRNYNGGSLKEVERYFGIMEREKPESNNIWLPETISGCQGLESTSSNTLIAIIDLVTKEYIMLDIDSAGSVVSSLDVQNTLKMIEQYATLPKVSVYDLVSLHVQARGQQVTAEVKADNYFKAEDFMTSYEETGKLMGI